MDVRAEEERGWDCFKGKDVAELPLSWDGNTIWCDGCDNGTRCGKSTLLGWPSGISPVVDVRTGQIVMEVGGGVH